MSDAMDGRRAVELGTEEVQKRLADGTAYLDVVVKGKWEIYKQHQEEWLICDQCRRMYHRWYFDENFCPNCGADMREGDAE